MVQLPFVMDSVIQQVEKNYVKNAIVSVRSGDVVRVHQRVKEGSKERIQVFEGLAIRAGRLSSLSATLTVRRIASGVGVEKTFLLHSPLIEKVEVVRRSKVRRKYLSYMRRRSGKSGRLASVEFDRAAVNKVNEPIVPEDSSKAAKEAKAQLDESRREDTAAENPEKDGNNSRDNTEPAGQKEPVKTAKE